MAAVAETIPWETAGRSGTPSYPACAGGVIDRAAATMIVEATIVRLFGRDAPPVPLE